jgi:hypothetical protein
MSGMRIRTAALLGAGLAFAACASTSLVESWKAPGAGPLRFNKVLALAIVKDESVRRVAEDALQATLKSVRAEPSYRVLEGANVADGEQLKEMKGRLQQDGFDGVVALRMVSSQQQASWTPIVIPLEAFWGTGSPAAEMSVETVARVEIKLYSLSDDKLIWSGCSETHDPKNAEQLVQEVVAAAGRELRKQGLIS